MAAERASVRRQRPRAGAVRVHDPDRGAGRGAECAGRDIDVLVGLVGDAKAVWRPRRARPFRGHLASHAATRRHHPDAAALVGVIRHLHPVRRPGGLHVLAAVGRQRALGAAFTERAHVDLERAAAVRGERQRIAAGRERRAHVEAGVGRHLHRPGDMNRGGIGRDHVLQLDEPRVHPCRDRHSANAIAVPAASETFTRAVGGCWCATPLTESRRKRLSCWEARRCWGARADVVSAVRSSRRGPGIACGGAAPFDATSSVTSCRGSTRNLGTSTDSRGSAPSR